MNLKSIQDNNFLKSIVAGACVSFGCICYLSIENKIIGAFLFSVWIISIITYRLNLYTGRIGLVKLLSDVIDCVIYLFGNMCGAFFTYIFTMFTPIYLKIQEPFFYIPLVKLDFDILCFV